MNKFFILALTTLILVSAASGQETKVMPCGSAEIIRLRRISVSDLPSDWNLEAGASAGTSIAYPPVSVIAEATSDSSYVRGDTTSSEEEICERACGRMIVYGRESNLDLRGAITCDSDSCPFSNSTNRACKLTVNRLHVETTSILRWRVDTNAAVGKRCQCAFSAQEGIIAAAVSCKGCLRDDGNVTTLPTRFCKRIGEEDSLTRSVICCDTRLGLPTQQNCRVFTLASAPSAESRICAEATDTATCCDTNNRNCDVFAEAPLRNDISLGDRELVAQCQILRENGAVFARCCKKFDGLTRNCREFRCTGAGCSAVDPERMVCRLRTVNLIDRLVCCSPMEMNCTVADRSWTACAGAPTTADELNRCGTLSVPRRDSQCRLGNADVRCVDSDGAERVFRCLEVDIGAINPSNALLDFHCTLNSNNTAGSCCRTSGEGDSDTTREYCVRFKRCEHRLDETAIDRALPDARFRLNATRPYDCKSVTLNGTAVRICCRKALDRSLGVRLECVTYDEPSRPCQDPSDLADTTRLVNEECQPAAPVDDCGWRPNGRFVCCIARPNADGGLDRECREAAEASCSDVRLGGVDRKRCCVDFSTGGRLCAVGPSRDQSSRPRNACYVNNGRYFCRYGCRRDEDTDRVDCNYRVCDLDTEGLPMRTCQCYDSVDSQIDCPRPRDSCAAVRPLDGNNCLEDSRRLIDDSVEGELRFQSQLDAERGGDELRHRLFRNITSEHEYMQLRPDGSARLRLRARLVWKRITDYIDANDNGTLDPEEELDAEIVDLAAEAAAAVDRSDDVVGGEMTAWFEARAELNAQESFRLRNFLAEKAIDFEGVRVNAGEAEHVAEMLFRRCKSALATRQAHFRIERDDLDNTDAAIFNDETESDPRVEIRSKTDPSARLIIRLRREALLPRDDFSGLSQRISVRLFAQIGADGHIDVFIRFDTTACFVRSIIYDPTVSGEGQVDNPPAASTSNPTTTTDGSPVSTSAAVAFRVDLIALMAMICFAVGLLF